MKNNKKIISIVFISCFLFFLVYIWNNYQARIDLDICLKCHNFESDYYVSNELIIPDFNFLMFKVSMKDFKIKNPKSMLNSSEIQLAYVDRKKEYLSKEKWIVWDESDQIAFNYMFIGIERKEISAVPSGKYLVFFHQENINNFQESFPDEISAHVTIYCKFKHARRWRKRLCHLQTIAKPV